jgi:hypothetical protein
MVESATSGGPRDAVPGRGRMSDNERYRVMTRHSTRYFVGIGFVVTLVAAPERRHTIILAAGGRWRVRRLSQRDSRHAP